MKWIEVTQQTVDTYQDTVRSPKKLHFVQALSGTNKGKWFCPEFAVELFSDIVGKKPTLVTVPDSDFKEDFTITKITVEYQDKDAKKDTVILTDEKDILLIKDKIKEKEDTKPIK